MPFPFQYEPSLNGWTTSLSTSSSIYFHQWPSSFWCLHFLSQLRAFKTIGFLAMSSVSSYVTVGKLSNLHFLICKIGIIIHVSQEFGLNEILYIKNSAHCSPDKHVPLSFFPIRNKITSKDSASQAWLHFLFFPSFQTLRPLPTVPLLSFTPPPQPTVIWLLPSHSMEIYFINETKMPQCSEFHRFKYFPEKPKNES